LSKKIENPLQITGIITTDVGIKLQTVLSPKKMRNTDAIIAKRI